MADETERRKPGRPKVEEPRTSVSTWMPARDHDRLIKLANQHGQSVSALVRELIKFRIR